jgi:ligand-binding SRPBCC domain-containing protein
MNVFETSFRVNAPLAAIASFHNSTAALRRLSPPPVFIQFHHLEPLTEGSRANFTMWFGPIPLRWTAVHSKVDPLHGFTDIQVRGPMKGWKHIHSFTAVNEHTTLVSEHVEYEHFNGLRGLMTRILFSEIGFRVLFWYRAVITRWSVRQS